MNIHENECLQAIWPTGDGERGTYRNQPWVTDDGGGVAWAVGEGGGIAWAVGEGGGIAWAVGEGGGIAWAVVEGGGIAWAAGEGGGIAWAVASKTKWFGVQVPVIGFEVSVVVLVHNTVTLPFGFKLFGVKSVFNTLYTKSDAPLIGG